MEQTKKNTTKNWIFFLLAFAAMMALMLSPWGQWFWLILPIVATQLALALDLL